MVDGTAGSSITVTDGTWTAGGTASYAGQTYAVYNSGASQLLIDSDLTRYGAVI